jgi:hypothetical protein
MRERKYRKWFEVLGYRYEHKPILRQKAMEGRPTFVR